MRISPYVRDSSFLCVTQRETTVGFSTHFYVAIVFMSSTECPVYSSLRSASFAMLGLVRSSLRASLKTVQGQDARVCARTRSLKSSKLVCDIRCIFAAFSYTSVYFTQYFRGNYLGIDNPQAKRKKEAFLLSFSLFRF